MERDNISLLKRWWGSGEVIFYLKVDGVVEIYNILLKK